MDKLRITSSGTTNGAVIELNGVRLTSVKQIQFTAGVGILNRIQIELMGEIEADAQGILDSTAIGDEWRSFVKADQ